MPIRKLNAAFAANLTLTEALETIGFRGAVSRRILTDYWELLEMERALEAGRRYYDKLMEQHHV